MAIAFVAACSAPLYAAPEYVPGEVLVRFKQPTSLTAARRVIPEAAAMADLGRDLKKVTLQPGLNVEQAMQSLQGRPDIGWVQPNYIKHVQMVPNDPRYGDQWALSKINAERAWDTTTGSIAAGSGVIVAVIDTGVDYDLPELSGNLWTSTNGWHGWNFVDGSSDLKEYCISCAHGTLVASVIGAAGNNSQGMAGVSWNPQLMILRAMDDNGVGTTERVVNAIYYAILHKARIINTSLGSSSHDPAEYLALSDARDAGVLVVAAACNFGADSDITPCFPASYDLENIISVAATDGVDQLIHDSTGKLQSNFGVTTVDLAAPGQHILAALPAGMGAAYTSPSFVAQYGFGTGTSMAAPLVSGAAALLWAHQPSLTWVEVKEKLLMSARPVPELKGKMLTGGVLDVAAALDYQARMVQGGGQQPESSRGGGGYLLIVELLWLAGAVLGLRRSRPRKI